MVSKIIKFPRAEIVEHEADSITPVLGETALWAAARLSAPTFFRIARLVPPERSLLSLERVLGRADYELEKIADLCGALVVPHTWGLYPHHEAPTQYPIPKGYVLVAEVDTIMPTHALEDTHRLSASERATRSKRLLGGISLYNQRRTDKWTLGDIRVNQALLDGVNLRAPSDPSAPYLLDIEPIFCKTPIPTYEMPVFPREFSDPSIIRTPS